MKEAPSGTYQRREYLAGSCTNSGNSYASDYQSWFTSVHFAPSIVKDVAFICIASLFHNMSLRYRYYYDNGKAWTSKTLMPARERLQRILANPDKWGKVKLSPPLLKRLCENPKNKNADVLRQFIKKSRGYFCLWKDRSDFYHHKLSYACRESGLQGTYCCSLEYGVTLNKLMDNSQSH